MEHTQLVLNFDNSYCIDIYSEKLLNKDFPAEMLDIIKFIEQQLQDVSNPSEIVPTLRNHPFHIAKCTNCGQLFASNRDNYITMNCQACKTQMTPEIVESEDAKLFISKFEYLKGDNLSALSSNYAVILIVLQNKNNKTTKIVSDILQRYDFNIIKTPDKKLVDIMTEIAEANITVNKNTRKNTIYASTTFTDNDIKFNGIIPRIEECDRAIRKAIPNTSTFSIDL